ncbi:tetratricopeptide repeat protein [Psychrobacter sp. GP33]|uniref:tetratricopeptide repeat protein n=1 Tax=Psychrobacter sp. GP33 TaxID=2758709 RepID=UPI0015F8EA28|nr:tetratricopeptide repeat protein [Psychrobacter sp. GP33]
MPLPSVKSALITPLDYMAEGYWQDFLAKRPITGGIAYESALQNSNLDESLLSLQRVDTLLSQIRRDLIQADRWNEQAIQADDKYRKLLIFLAFYTGRVLEKYSQKTVHWYGQLELRTLYLQLNTINDDFYRHMALFVEDVTPDTLVENSVLPVFFALESIGMRLFGHIDRQFRTIFGGQVAGGLYQAVTDFLSTLSAKAQPNAISKPQLIFKSELEPVVTATPLRSISSQSKISQPQAVMPKKQIIESVVPVISNISVAPKLPIDEPSTTKNLIKPVIVTPEIFTQLLIELNEIEVVQTAGNSEYQQACKILDQFERHIAKQDKSRAQVMFSEAHQSARQRALQLLAEAATAGNTAAMARLAMYELLGEGLKTDKNSSQLAGVEWIKQAASANDSRAQRLLSKLYYQGVGVSQDMDAGKLWLEQAAKNGHPEAATVLAQWQQAQSLISVQQKEQDSIKRYQLLIAAIAIAALLLIIFV